MKTKTGIIAIVLCSLALIGCMSSAERKKIAAVEANLKTYFESPEWKKKLESAIRSGARGAEELPLVEEPPVLWKAHLPTAKGSKVMDARFVAPDRLFVAYNNSAPVLIDTKRKALLWTFTDIWGYFQEGKKRGQKYDSYSFVAAYNGMVIMCSYGDEGSALFAIDMENGKPRWAAEMKNARPAGFLPVYHAGVLIAVQHDKSEANISAYNLSTGSKVWGNSYGYARGLKKPPFPVITASAILDFYDGIELTAADTGKTLWKLADIRLDDQCPPPRIEGDTLFVADRENTLHWINTGTGRAELSMKLKDDALYMSIYPSDGRIYLRGSARGTSEEMKYFLTAIRKQDGKELWVFEDAEPSVSNLIDENGRLFFATWSTVTVLDRESGKRLFAVTASQTGKSYPVQIRKYKDRIVYIGELIITAFDAKSGAKLYSQGFDPLSQDFHMDALDQRIEKLRDYLSHFGSIGRSSTGMVTGSSAYFFDQARNSQNRAYDLSQLSREQYSAYRSSGSRSDYWKSQSAGLTAQIDSAYAQAQYSVAMSFMTLDNMQQGIARFTAGERMELEKLVDIRRNLHILQQTHQEGNYAFRPFKERGFVGISVVHLPSGHTVSKTLTREYKDLGLYNLVDIEQGIIYFHGMRILSDEEPTPDMIKRGVLYHGVYLIADKLALPR